MSLLVLLITVYSGTNGYVVRNLSHLRSRDPLSDRAADFEKGGPSLREPDQGILEHERKRKVELQCLELQLELEENGSANLLGVHCKAY